MKLLWELYECTLATDAENEIETKLYSLPCSRLVRLIVMWQERGTEEQKYLVPVCGGRAAAEQKRGKKEEVDRKGREIVPPINV